MSTARRLIKGSIFRNAELCVLLVVSFLMTPLIVHSLGDRMYGVWTLVGIFMGYYGLLDFGLSSAASRFISQSLGRNDYDEMSRVATTACTLFSMVGAAALLITILIAAACPFFIHDPSEAVLFRKIILLIGVATAVSFPARVFDGILNSHLRYDYTSCIAIARTLLSNAAIYYYLSRGHGIMTVTFINFLASLLQNAGSLVVAKTQYPHVRVGCLHAHPAQVRAMFSYSWKTFVGQICDILRFRIDALMIAGFLRVDLVTPYSVGVRILDGFSKLALSSIGGMMPIFSQYEGRGDYPAIRAALLRVTTFSTLLCSFIGFSILFYGRAFIARWMGPGYDSSYHVAVILCISSLIALPQSPGIQVLYGISKHGVYMVINICEAIANVLLSYIFLKHYGMYGVAIGTTVEMLIFKLFVQPVCVCRAIQLPVRTYLLETVLANMLKAAILLGSFFFLIRGMVAPSYGRLFCCMALQTLFFVPAAFFLVLREPERRYILSLFRPKAGSP